MTNLISLDEKELLSRLKESDQDAFELLYDRYASRIFQNTLRLTKSTEIAEELVQETFYRVWEKRATIDIERSIKSYLFRIAENLAYDFFRKVARDKKLAKVLVDAASANYDHINELITYKEDNAILTAAIDALSPKRKEIFTLCKLEGKSYHEVSQLLGITESTINDHIVKATKVLKEYCYKSGQSALIMIISFLITNR